MENHCTTLLRQVVSAHPGMTATAAGSGQGRILVGLIGRGIQQSRTPAMHEREAARLGLGCAYVLVDFDRLDLPDHALAGMLAAGARLGFQGFNVTHPFKQAVLPLLDAVAAEAAAIGAVNTVVYRNGRTEGHNTDGWGFGAAFADRLGDVARRHVVQFGAGGAGAAVADALMRQGVERLDLVDNDRDRAAALCRRMRAAWGDRVHVADDVAAALERADGIVNATPVGMDKYPGMAFAARLLRPGHWVAEIIYFPEETELLRVAAGLGCRTLSGTGMAIGQAVRAFELFTGRKPDMAAMACHFAAAA